jgi:hypothetical protein
MIGKNQTGRNLFPVPHPVKGYSEKNVTPHPRGKRDAVYLSARLPFHQRLFLVEYANSSNDSIILWMHLQSR